MAAGFGALIGLLGTPVGALPVSGDAYGGTYKLLNACGGKTLDVRRRSLDDGAAVQTWADGGAGSINQQWVLTAAGNGDYTLSARHSGKVLDVRGAGADKGTPVVQWREESADHPLWKLLETGGHIEIAPKHAPRLRLDVKAGSKENGAAVQLWTENGSCAQAWTLARVAAPPQDGRQALRVSDNGRFLVGADGSPFFYLADTAWELFHRLNRAEVRRYLEKRSEQGFTVIQAVALSGLGGPGVPNVYGDLPLIGKNPARPAVTPGSNPANKDQYDYWDHVDYVVNEAAGLGLHVALLPTWGSWVGDRTIFTPASAKAYGEFLGRRYKDKGVIWVLGGDRVPTQSDLEVWRAMAEGIERGVGGRDKALISFHPRGGHSSAEYVHADPWLDFNMWQTGHCRDVKEWAKIGQTYALKPTKPVLNSEPIYEGHPLCFDVKNGYSDAADVRAAAYWSVFAGAFGHTYGHHAVWQMHDEGQGGTNAPRQSWQDALNDPGARQMRFLRALITSRPMLERVPDQSLLQDAYSGAQRVQATRGGDYAFVYSAAGQPFTVNLGRLRGKQLRAAWFDPRSGKSQVIGIFENVGTRRFTPPSQGRKDDWVLLLDDASRKYPLP